jgi:lipopolysaccharide export system protein LptA
VRYLAYPIIALALAASAAYAETADKSKPISFTSDGGEVNYEKKTGVLTGNVVITQGTLTIRADKINFKQNADNSLSATCLRQSHLVPPEARRRRRLLRRMGAARRIRRQQGAARALRQRDTEARNRRDPQQLHHVQLEDRALQGGGPPVRLRRSRAKPGATTACAARSSPRKIRRRARPLQPSRTRRCR